MMFAESFPGYHWFELTPSPMIHLFFGHGGLAVDRR
jgi:hypothetical protein